jgi:hypothetical protein
MNVGYEDAENEPLDKGRENSRTGMCLRSMWYVQDASYRSDAQSGE